MDDLAQLLKAAQAGDARAFEALARSQSDRIFSIAYRVTGNTSTAEDVVQEAFLRLLKSRTSLRREGAAHAWLARVATRLALDAIRRQDARRRLERRRAMLLKGREEAPPDPLLSSEESRTLSQAFARLPGEIRA